MWRGCIRRRSRYTAVSPNAEPASDRAVRTAGSRSAGVATVRMPLPPPPATAFTTSGYPIRGRGRDDLRVGRVVRKRRFGAGHDRHAGRDRGLPRGRLAAHERDGVRRRADERQARIDAGLGEVLVLREEPVAGMDERRARLLRDVNDAVDAQVAFGGRARADRVRLVGQTHVQRVAVAFRIDRDGRRSPVPGRRE